MFGLSEEKYESIINKADDWEIDGMLMEKFNVDIFEFGAIVEALLPMTMPQEKAISGDLVHVFGVFDSLGFISICEHKSLTLQVVKNDSENQSNEEKPK